MISRLKYLQKTGICVIILFSVVLFSGCFQIHTDNPEKAFKYWTGISSSNSEVDVINGKYWRSSHFTLEYEVYLKMKVSAAWKTSLIELNEMLPDTTEWYCPKDVPSWFFFPEEYVKYKSALNDNLLLWEQLNGDTVYIYDLQL